MRHVLAPTVEDQEGKGVIVGDQVMVVVEIVIDPVVSKSLNRAVERG
jgi:formylmethanofuran:tetrahydromethanopterin formyltransferase